MNESVRNIKEVVRDDSTGIAESMEARLLVNLQGSLTTDIGARVNIEERWLDDVRQYIGAPLSDEDEVSAKSRRRSTIIGKLTRNLCNTGEARMADMVLPTDERNWAIDAIVDARIKELANPETVSGVDPVGDVEDGNEAPTESEEAQGYISASKARAEAMEETVENQLVRSKYQAHWREMIHNASIMGTAISKGPVVKSKRSRVQYGYEKRVDEDGVERGDWYPSYENEQSPGLEIVDCWHFYPDYQASSIDDCNHMHERHIMTPLQFQRLSKNAGWSKEKVDLILDEGPSNISHSNTNYLTFRQITTGHSISMDGRFEVWEYTGMLSKKVDFDNEPPKWWEDREWMLVKVFYTSNTILEIRPVLLETEEFEYSTFSWEDDPTTIWGDGGPALMRSSAKLANGALRGLSDNMGLARGPNAVVNPKHIEPENGGYTIEALKVWKMKQTNARARDALHFIDIPIHSQEFLNVLNKAEAMAREETSQPPLVTGEGAQYQTDKVGGLAILQNNANIVDRRRVKNFDDCVIAPTVTRFYHYNMQFGNEEIKGDFEVIARGSVELLAKHMRGQSIEMIAELANHPIFGPMHKLYETAQRIYQNAQMEPGDYLKPKDQALKSLSEAQEAAQQVGKEGMTEDDALLAARKLDLEERKLEVMLRVEEIKLEGRIMEVAAREDVSLAQINATLDKVRTDKEIATMKDKTERDKVSAEISFKERTGRPGI